MYMSMETEPVVNMLYSVEIDTIQEPSNPTCFYSHSFGTQSNESRLNSVIY
jgi:hypothetical protein